LKRPRNPEKIEIDYGIDEGVIPVDKSPIAKNPPKGEPEQSRDEVLDPYGFYRRKVSKYVDESAGLERFVYKLFGTDLVSSVALAINPLAKFRIPDERIAPVNRTRKFTANGTPWARKRRHKETQIIGRSPPNVLTSDPFDREAYSESVTVPSNTTVSLTAQGLINGTIKDTTRRTRAIGYEQGEFELWIPRVRCPAARRQRISLESNTYTSAGGYTYRSRDAEFMSDFTVGPAARITPSAVDALKTSEQAILEAAMGDNAINIASRCMPTRREFGMTRSVAELKDLPLSLKGTIETYLELRGKHVSVKHPGQLGRNTAPAEYLNAQFGWLPIWNDVQRILSLPEKIARRVNRLMKREGQDSTFRAGWTLLPSTISSPPSFTFDLLVGETLVNVATHGTRSIELRGMVNANVRLPDLEVPKLRKELMRNAWGLYPNPEDVYNLTPWTWLVDWFGGIGDYVNCYNIMNTDPSVINYGFLTGISTIQVDTVHTSKATRTQKVSLTPPVPATVTTETIVENVTRTARLEGKLQIRKAFGSAYGLRMTPEIQDFTGYQYTILGALLLSRH
jgi:hypothetical protein